MPAHLAVPCSAVVTATSGTAAAVSDAAAAVDGNENSAARFAASTDDFASFAPRLATSGSEVVMTLAETASDLVDVASSGPAPGFTPSGSGSGSGYGGGSSSGDGSLPDLTAVRVTFPDAALYIATGSAASEALSQAVSVTRMAGSQGEEPSMPSYDPMDGGDAWGGASFSAADVFEDAPAGKSEDVAGAGRRRRLHGRSLHVVNSPDLRQRVSVVNVKSYPFRAVGQVKSSRGSCTGALIARAAVLTAGHCVHGGACQPAVRREGWGQMSGGMHVLEPWCAGKLSPVHHCSGVRCWSPQVWFTKSEPT